ncbi:beta-1,3-galactosyltransferase 5-like [Octopus vulgaris]|uniref:Hexosyltransferase n=1 Tax=Octopus vulgaris TaxID=6645 RepID=A0AA36BT01_OCTVU|nr:beta-1,3-galactosyltransferase 5-like [Octopus vulgaris]
MRILTMYLKIISSLRFGIQNIVPFFCLFVVVGFMLMNSHFPGESTKVRLVNQHVVMKAKFHPRWNRTISWNLEELFVKDVSKPSCCSLCSFVILIISAPRNVEQRMAIRQTWCQPPNSSMHTGDWLGLKLDAGTRNVWGNRDHTSDSRRWQCVFLIGRTSDAKTELAIQQEMETHKDILLGSYIDTYRNLTLKVFHGFYWVHNSCKPNFVLKTDDDCFVNTALIYHLLTHSNNELVKKKLYVGDINLTLQKRIVLRHTASKWKVKKTEYNEPYYPPYASGLGYILSADVIAEMLDISKYFTPFPNEDAFVGMVLNFLGITPINSQRFTSLPSGWTICNFLYLLVIHNIAAASQKTLQNKTNLAPLMCKRQHFITTWN